MARGSIRKRSNVSWTIYYDLPPDPVTGKRRQKAEAVRGTKKEAERILAKRIAEVDEGMYADPSKMSLADFLQRWLEDHAQQRLKRSTYTSYEGMIRNHVLTDLGNVKLNKLQPMHLQSLYKKKLDSLSPRSVEYIHSILRSALNRAVTWGLINHNPTDRVSPPRPQKKELQYWTEEQARRFIIHTKGERLHTLYRLALTTGMRRGELLGLRWKDVEGEAVQIRQELGRSYDGQLYFDTPKTAAAIRRIPLSEDDVAALSGHRAAQAEEKLQAGQHYQDNDLVFPTQIGTPINPSNLLREFKRLTREAGLPEIRFHDLRHTHATMLLESGAHPRVVQDRLGHTQVSVVLDTYSHVAPSMQEEATESIKQKFR